MPNYRLERTWSISLKNNQQSLGSTIAELRFHDTKADTRRHGGLSNLHSPSLFIELNPDVSAIHSVFEWRWFETGNLDKLQGNKKYQI